MDFDFAKQSSGAPTSGLPAAFFITHTIDGDSPLYSPEKPYRADFSGIIRLFVTVEGYEAASQEHVVGGEDWGRACIHIDRKFSSMYAPQSRSSRSGSNKGKQAFDFKSFHKHEPIAEAATFSKDCDNPAKPSDFGLPPAAAAVASGQ